MKTLVVYDSLYGNTEAIAHAVAPAIAHTLAGDASVKFVGDVAPVQLETVDLLVIGSPTHGALPTDAIQAWIEQTGSPAHDGARAATFDTRLTWRFLERWGGFAAPKMADMLRVNGWTLVGTPGGFFVRGLKKGPLKPGEKERAAAWAKEVAESAQAAAK